MNGALALREPDISREERLNLDQRYQVAVRETAQLLIDENGSLAAIKRAIESDFQDLINASAGEQVEVYDRVKYDLLNEVDLQVGPTAAQQANRTRLVGLGATLAVILLAVIYGLVRQNSATPVTAALESRAGIEQRAAALAKVLRYDSFGVRGRGLVGIAKAIVLWPIEPTEREAASAGEFAGATIGLAREMASRNLVCNLSVGNDDSLSADEIAMLEHVSSALREPSFRWATPPVASIVEIIRVRFPCR